MVKVRNDLTGSKFTRLTVIEQADDYISPSGQHYAMWLCKCDCDAGKTITARTSNLTSGHTTSCGCLKSEKVSIRSRKSNKYDLSGEYGIGYDCNGKEFWFDLEDYNLIKKYCWYTDDKGYVVTKDFDNGGRSLQIHRLIMNVFDKNIDVDHKHGDTTRHDNRKSNLRETSRSQNNMNKRRMSNNKSGVTGVTWNKQLNKWQAHIGINNKHIHLGYFDDFEDAVKVRKEAEEKYFGEYSYDNSQRNLN